MKKIQNKYALLTGVGITFLSSFIFANELGAKVEKAEELDDSKGCISRQDAARSSFLKLADICGDGIVKNDIKTVIQDLSPIKKSHWNNDYEDLKDCGYHPQRKELSCIIEIKKGSGFLGRSPHNNNFTSVSNNRGTYEHVQFCVKYDGQPWQYVAASAVHIYDLDPSHSNEEAGKPVWRYSVTIQANDYLPSHATFDWNPSTPSLQTANWLPWTGQGYNGQTLKVKAHSSWLVRVPVNNACQSLWKNYPWQDSIKPFHIKLDPS